MDEIFAYTTAHRALISIVQLGQAMNKTAQSSKWNREMASIVQLNQAINKAKAAQIRMCNQEFKKSIEVHLKTWVLFLADAGADLINLDFYNTPESWAGVTHGLVLGFVEWMKQKNFAISTINEKLACIRTFCAMAAQAKIINTEELVLINMVRAIRNKQVGTLDAQGARNALTQPQQANQAKLTELSAAQAQALKVQPATFQGYRDTLLICLLLEQGLHAREIIALTFANFDLPTGQLVYRRGKSKKEQKDKLTAETISALHNYTKVSDCAKGGPLLYNRRKSGQSRITEQAVRARVRQLGRAIGVSNLSVHVCLHYWSATSFLSQKK